MRVLVCGWVGSTNLGDELVLRGALRLLGSADDVTVVSVDAAATARVHGVAAIDHRRADRLAAAARAADLVVFGGGGLVQDETSPFNLPYHLSRVWLARGVRTPWVGLGLGVGPLRTRTGRLLARTLSSATAVSVRDPASRTLLASLGIRSFIGADLALHLAGSETAQPRVDVEGSEGHVAVALRPWNTERSRLPVGWGGTPSVPAWFVPTVAAALDRLQARTGLDVELVALQADRDGPLNQEVARAMQRPARTVIPDVDEVVATLGRAQAVVAMRYHAGIAATLTGRPSVLIGYSPKVTSLAGDLGRGAMHLPFEQAALAGIDGSVAGLLARTDAESAVTHGLERLTQRAAVNAAVLERARQ